VEEQGERGIFPKALRSPKVIMNGAPGNRICHARGLRLGDPLSPMLFVLVMEVLDSLFRKADSWSLFQSLGLREMPFHTPPPLYADDMAIFISPCLQDIRLTRGIRDTFQKASGLACNLTRSQLVPIRCAEDQIAISLQEFPCQLATFPIKYLGMPLSVSKLPKTTLQPLVDRVADKLPALHGRLMHRSGRLTLIKTTLSAIPVYTSISLCLPQWLRKALQKVMKHFLWMGTEEVQGWKCLVAWSRIQRPLQPRGWE
jgi:hypothetical protein